LQSDAAAQVGSEQARWTEINQRLEELDRRWRRSRICAFHDPAGRNTVFARR
jgi:hypothetical protein